MNGMGHDFSGSCMACETIFNRYSGFANTLKIWFKALQIEHPDLHISCAGRGRDDQEALFHRGASRAHYAQSSHNWNAAIDVFQQKEGVYTLDAEWFHLIFASKLGSEFVWYGSEGARFYELPHIELADWKVQAKNGVLSLVEV